MDVIEKIEKWNEVELFWDKDKSEWHLSLITYNGSGIMERRGETLEKAYKKIQEKAT